MSTHEQLWWFCFGGVKNSMEFCPAKHVVVASETGRMRTLPFKAHTNCELRSPRVSVYTLHPSVVDPSELINEGRVTTHCPFSKLLQKKTCNSGNT